MDSGSYSIIPTNLERLGIVGWQMCLAISGSKSMVASLSSEGSAM